VMHDLSPFSGLSAARHDRAPLPAARGPGVAGHPSSQLPTTPSR
jgi:hypothetical protein